jgi:phosphatidylserine/phosphatidylglycerophosphate/cardiolipin synthase-like enzyme
VLFLVFSLLIDVQVGHTIDLTLLKDTPVKIYFSPRGGCTDAIINAIEQAKAEIKVQAYSFTSAPIAKALLVARKRNVNVQIILDKSQKKQSYSSYTFFHNQGIPVYVDSAHAVAHNKIIIIDQETIITGSFNFTKAAEEKNAENLLIITSKDLAKIYIENWKNHFEHAEKYLRE